MPATIRSCSYCDSHFSKIEHLKRHERAHTGEKPFQCSKCHKRFSRGDVLNRHLKGHNDGDTAVSATGTRRSRANRPSPRARAGPQPPANVDAVQSLLDDSTSPASSSAQIAASVDSGSVTGTQKRQPSNGTQASSPPAQSPASSILREGAQPSQVSNVTVSDNNGIPATTENALPSLLQDQIFTFPESAVEASAMSATVGGEIDPNRLSEFLSSQDFNHFAAYNGQDGGFPMDKEPEWTIGLGDDFPMMDNNSAPWAETPLMNPHMSRAGVSQAGTVSSSTSIPDRRLARIERLWSKKGGRPWRLMQSLWADVTAHGRDNILSTVASSTLEFENSARRFTLNGIDDERRSSFIEEFSVPNTPVEATIDTRFPSPDTIGLCIHIYFQRFHPVLPLIHRPTFSPRHTPNLVLFPLFLIGYYLLDRKRYQPFVVNHLSTAVQKCNEALSKQWTKAEAVDLIAVLTAASLLLSCSAIIEERVSCEETYALYTHALLTAQQHSLFECDKGHHPDNLTAQEMTSEASWEGWARRESCKRLPSCLLMLDSYFSFHIGASPIIRLDNFNIFPPSSTVLFEAPDAREWSKLAISAGNIESHVLDIRPHQTRLAGGLSSSPVAMHTLLSAIWSRFIDVRHRVLLQEHTSQRVVLYPAEVCHKDASGVHIVPLLRETYNHYETTLHQGNPNALVAWNHIFMSLTANLDLLELCAGREGSSSAKAALQSISTWSSTPSARRACLHAAQVYKNMARRTMTDNTMFQSEIALFNAALVLGLYLYVEPSTIRQQFPVRAGAPFELVSEVDWREIGYEGLPGYTTVNTISSSAAARFVREGGPITFSGIPQPGGYSSARMVIVDYIDLLDEVGKWNTGEFCRILRMICDTSNDPDLAGDGL